MGKIMEVPISQTFHGKNEGELLEVKNADFMRENEDRIDIVQYISGEFNGKKIHLAIFH
jgi:hypothetical protein